jgi:hypothetical protein
MSSLFKHLFFSRFQLYDVNEEKEKTSIRRRMLEKTNNGKKTTKSFCFVSSFYV